MIRTPALVSSLALLVGVLASPATATPESERTFKKFTLKNGLKVVIASDPKVNVSAASMSVGIGANADPKDAAGLAHFLEHMLFLANKKYPKLNDYSEFLRARGGYSNAYTSSDHTNYHFQVNHEGLAEALDRFAQFFISPTLDYKFAKREVMAVNSEHQKNIMDDTWRLMQLQRAHVRAGHPAGNFSTGNKDTLANVRESQLRGFFNDFYGARNLALAVIGKQPLGELERLVRERFAAVPDRKVQPFNASPDLLEEKRSLRLLRVVPVKDLRQLKLYFEVPPQHKKVLHHTSTMVGMTFGDEGKGSLLSYLKQLGLATSLSAGIQDTRYYSACHVTVGLSPKGLKQWRKVLKLCFAYTTMLRRNKFPQHVWEEMRTLAQLKQKFAAKPEGTDAAITLANNALDHGLELAEKVEYTFKSPDPEGYRELVNALRPNNCVAFLVAKGLPTDKKETHYGTQYSYTEETGKPFAELQEVRVPKAIHLPHPNPFLPKNVSLQPEQPVKIRSDESVTLWYAQDTEFKRPKVAIHLHLLTPEAFGTPRATILTQLYAGIIQEQLNELAYPALMAGLAYSLTPTRKGLMFTVSGYSDSAFKLMGIVARAMRGELDRKTFDTVKFRMGQGLKNFPLSQAWQIARELARKISYKRYYLPNEAGAALKPLSLDDLRQHVGTLLSRTHIEGLAAGNLTADQAKHAVEQFRSTIGSRPFDPKKAHTDHVLWLKAGDDVWVREGLATNNAALRIDYQVGASDLKTRMATQLIARGLQNAFYTEMRTRQKLGYIVFSGTYNRRNVQQLVYIIQSGTHEADDLHRRATACIDAMPELFKTMPQGRFEAIRRSLIRDRQKPAKTIAGKAARFYLAAFEKGGDFDWIEREIEALRSLKREDVQALLERAVSPETRRRVNYLLRAKHHTAKKSGVNLGTFSEGRTYTTAPEGRR